MRFFQTISLLSLAVASQAMPLANGGFEDPGRLCGSGYPNNDDLGAETHGNCDGDDNAPFFERFKKKLPSWEVMFPANSDNDIAFERWNNGVFGVVAKEGNSFIELNTEGLTTVASHPVQVENCDYSTITFWYRARTEQEGAEKFKVTIENMENGQQMSKTFTSVYGVWKQGTVGPIMVMNQDNLKVDFMSLTGLGNSGVTKGNFIDDVREKCTTPEIGMDPHVMKWNGDSYDFMGQCDLVLATEPGFGNGAGLDIHARTTIYKDYSFIETAAVRIGEETLEVSSWGDWTLNGVTFNNAQSAPLSIAGYPVYHRQLSKKKNVFDIVVDSGKNITVDNFKDFVNVKIHMPLPGSLGLLGEFGTGKSLARDGETVIKDFNAFGQEWQVIDTEPKLFQTDRAPQYPNKCIFPTESQKQARRLGDNGISEEAAKLACAKFEGATLEACVHDVMATGDLETAEAGAY